MIQDSINHIVQVVLPSNCKCDSIHLISKLPESGTSTNGWDVFNTIVICVAILLVIVLILYSLKKATFADKKEKLKETELKKANNELKDKNKKLEEEIGQFKKMGYELLEKRIQALEDKIKNTTPEP